MQATPDQQLLRLYAERRNEIAFHELVSRHMSFVYSAALRQVESSAAAADIAQGVFTDLARKSPELLAKPGSTSLAGWLHRATRYAALNHLRDSRRRLNNEKQAMQQLLNDSEPSADWEQIRPVLDEALDNLGDDDREALLLRFFQNQDFRTIGLALGVGDDTAQKRVSRAVERLRAFFAKRKITIGAGSLGILISANAVQAAPVGLVATVCSAALAGSAAVSTTVIAATAKTIVMTTLQKTIIGSVLAVAIGAGIYETRRAAQLREQNQSLRQQMDKLLSENARLSTKTSTPMPHFPAPPIQAAAPAITNALAAEDIKPADFMEQMFAKRQKAMLTPEQVESFLKANGRSAANLLAAYRASGDRALLEEAVQNFPDDPQVAYQMIEKVMMNASDLTPEEQRRRLEAFRKSAPDNALANYLLAKNYFDTGQIDEGLKELSAASGKKLDDYFASRGEGTMEAFLSAGCPPADASIFSFQCAVIPQVDKLKQLAQQMTDLASAYRQAGDPTSAQAVLLMAAAMGQQYDNPSPGQPSLCQRVGNRIEKNALLAMDPNTSYGGNGQTVQARLNQLDQQMAAAKEIGGQVEKLMPLMTPQDFVIYNERFLRFGDQNAQSWLISKYGQR